MSRLLKIFMILLALLQVSQATLASYYGFQSNFGNITLTEPATLYFSSSSVTIVLSTGTWLPSGIGSTQYFTTNLANLTFNAPSGGVPAMALYIGQTDASSNVIDVTMDGDATPYAINMATQSSLTFTSSITFGEDVYCQAGLIHVPNGITLNFQKDATFTAYDYVPTPNVKVPTLRVNGTMIGNNSTLSLYATAQLDREGVVLEGPSILQNWLNVKLYGTTDSTAMSNCSSCNAVRIGYNFGIVGSVDALPSVQAVNFYAYGKVYGGTTTTFSSASGVYIQRLSANVTSDFYLDGKGPNSTASGSHGTISNGLVFTVGGANVNITGIAYNGAGNGARLPAGNTLGTNDARLSSFAVRGTAYGGLQTSNGIYLLASIYTSGNIYINGYSNGIYAAYLPVSSTYYAANGNIEIFGTSPQENSTSVGVYLLPSNGVQNFTAAKNFFVTGSGGTGCKIGSNTIRAVAVGVFGNLNVNCTGNSDMGALYAYNSAWSSKNGIVMYGKNKGIGPGVVTVGVNLTGASSTPFARRDLDERANIDKRIIITGIIDNASTGNSSVYMYQTQIHHNERLYISGTIVNGIDNSIGVQIVNSNIYATLLQQIDAYGGTGCMIDPTTNFGSELTLGSTQISCVSFGNSMKALAFQGQMTTFGPITLNGTDSATGATPIDLYVSSLVKSLNDSVTIYGSQANAPATGCNLEGTIEAMGDIVISCYQGASSPGVGTITVKGTINSNGDQRTINITSLTTGGTFAYMINGATINVGNGSLYMNGPPTGNKMIIMSNPLTITGTNALIDIVPPVWAYAANFRIMPCPNCSVYFHNYTYCDGSSVFYFGQNSGYLALLDMYGFEPDVAHVYADLVRFRGTPVSTNGGGDTPHLQVMGSGADLYGVARYFYSGSQNPLVEIASGNYDGQSVNFGTKAAKIRLGLDDSQPATIYSTSLTLSNLNVVNVTVFAANVSDRWIATSSITVTNAKLFASPFINPIASGIPVFTAPTVIGQLSQGGNPIDGNPYDILYSSGNVKLWVDPCSYTWDSLSSTLTFNTSGVFNMSTPVNGTFYFGPCTLKQVVPGLSQDGPNLKFNTSIGPLNNLKIVTPNDAFTSVVFLASGLQPNATTWPFVDIDLSNAAQLELAGVSIETLVVFPQGARFKGPRFVTSVSDVEFGDGIWFSGDLLVDVSSTDTNTMSYVASVPIIALPGANLYKVTSSSYYGCAWQGTGVVGDVDIWVNCTSVDGNSLTLSGPDGVFNTSKSVTIYATQLGAEGASGSVAVELAKTASLNVGGNLYIEAKVLGSNVDGCAFEAYNGHISVGGNLVLKATIEAAGSNVAAVCNKVTDYAEYPVLIKTGNGNVEVYASSTWTSDYDITGNFLIKVGGVKTNATFVGRMGFEDMLYMTPGSAGSLTISGFVKNLNTSGIAESSFTVESMGGNVTIGGSIDSIGTVVIGMVGQGLNNLVLAQVSSSVASFGYSAVNLWMKGNFGPTAVAYREGSVVYIYANVLATLNGAINAATPSSVMYVESGSYPDVLTVDFSVKNLTVWSGFPGSSVASISIGFAGMKWGSLNKIGVRVFGSTSVDTWTVNGVIDLSGNDAPFLASPLFGISPPLVVFTGTSVSGQFAQGLLPTVYNPYALTYQATKILIGFTEGFYAPDPTSSQVSSGTPTYSVNWASPTTDVAAMATSGSTASWFTLTPTPSYGAFTVGPSCQATATGALVWPTSSCTMSYSANAFCGTVTETLLLGVGVNSATVWGTKTLALTFTSTACPGSFVNTSPLSTSLATPTSFTVPSTALSVTVASGPTTISWGPADGPVPTGGSVSVVGGPCTTLAPSGGQYGLPVGCNFKYVPTAACTTIIDSFGIAVGAQGGQNWGTKTVTVTIPPTACATSTTTTTNTATSSVTYTAAPGGRVGVAAQGVTGEEISEAGTNTGGPIVVNGSGSMTASPQQASRNAPIVFTQTLTTARSLGAYILDGIVIRQPGTPWTWTIVNGGLVSSPMGTNVGFNLTGVQITSAANGQVSVTFSMTPNTCDNKATCMINGTEAGLSTPTNFIADVTVKAYVQSSPGVLQYENVVISAPFSVVGKPLVYVPAPDGKVGVVNNGTTAADLNNAGTNTGGPILSPGTFGPDNNTTLVGTPVRFTQKLTSGRSLQGFLLNNVVVRRPGTGGIWTLVNGGVKVEPMATNVGFSLSNVVIAPSGTGDVEVSFDITPNVCANPTTCMLSQQDLQSLSTLFEVDLTVKGFAFAPGQTSDPLQAQELSSTTSFAVAGNAPVVYGPAPGGLIGKAGTTVTSGDITSATLNGGGAILGTPSTLTPGKPNIVIGATEQFTSSVSNSRLLKAFMLQNLIIQQTGTAYTWQLIKDGKLTSIGQGMGFNLDNVVIESLADGTVVAKFTVMPNVCNIKANCLMTIPESQNPVAIQYRVVLSLRGYADGPNGLVYQDLDQISTFSLSGTAVTTTTKQTATATTIVIPTTGFTFNPSSNIAMNTLINGADVAAATSLPTASATRIVSAQITRLTTLPISTTLAAPTPIIFRAVYDAVQDSRPLLAAQVMRMVVIRAEAPFKNWTLVNNGVEQPIAKTLDFGSLVTINPDGSDGVAFVWFDANRAILGTGPMIADITMRWYVEAHQLKRAVPLAWVQLRKVATFAVGGTTTSSTKSMSKTSVKTSVKTTSVKTTSGAKTTTGFKTTTTKKPLPTNYIIAETCAPGKKYNNPLNCCCAPGSAGKVTKKVTATKTITVRKGAKVTGAPKRDLMVDELMTKEDLRSRQDNGVVGQHLCQSCPLIGLKTNKKIYCCPRKVTVTRTVKTVYKTRTV